MSTPSDSPKFRLGNLHATPALQAAVKEDDFTAALLRHHRGDWGDVNDGQLRKNNEAVTTGGEIISVYKDSTGTEFWIITAQDRSRTQICLPGEAM